MTNCVGFSCGWPGAQFLLVLELLFPIIVDGCAFERTAGYRRALSSTENGCYCIEKRKHRTPANKANEPSFSSGKER